jgi:hypothetical protein
VGLIKLLGKKRKEGKEEVYFIEQSFFRRVGCRKIITYDDDVI